MCSSVTSWVSSLMSVFVLPQCLFCSVTGGSRWTLCSGVQLALSLRIFWLSESHAVHAKPSWAFLSLASVHQPMHSSALTAQHLLSPAELRSAYKERHTCGLSAYCKHLFVVTRWFRGLFFFFLLIHFVNSKTIRCVGWEKTLLRIYLEK